MTGRERLLTAVRLEEPDRVPYFCQGEPRVDEMLKSHFGVQEIEDVHDRLGCDMMRPLPLRKKSEEPSKPVEKEEEVQKDIWGVERRKIATQFGEYREISRSPLADAKSLEDVKNYPWPDPDDVKVEDLELADNWKALRERGLFLEMGFVASFGVACAMRGMEKVLMDLVLSPGMVLAIVEEIDAYLLGLAKKYYERWGHLIDVVGCGDDYGTEEGLLMSREHFRKFFKPPLKRQFELAMKYGCIPFQHCCGAIYELIPDFIDCGVQILNPIQTRAKGMEPERLKREFGKDICFHGSIDVQRSLPFGTCEEVRQEVRDRIRVLGPGGFVLGPSHNIQPDTPLENILALYDEARKSGCLR